MDELSGVDIERSKNLCVKIGRVLFPVAVVCAVLGIFLLSPPNLHKTVRAVAAVGPETLCLVLLLSLSNYSFRFWRWQMLLGGRSAPVPVGRSFITYVAGFALTATPGKAGETMRSLYLRPFGIPVRKSLAAFYTERLLDLVVIGMLAMLLVLHPGFIVRALGFAGGAIAIGLLAMQHPRFTALIEKLATALPVARFGAAAVAFLHDVRAMTTTRLALAGILLGLFAWASEGLETYLVAHSMGLHLDVSLALGIYAAAMIAGVLSFVPGGLGGTEVVMMSLLIYAGAAAPVAFAATLVVRLATLWFAVAIGLAAWIGIELFRPQIAKAGVSASEGIPSS